jgi:hypothetical protein
MDNFNELELPALCKEWQKILRLQDWLIYPEVCRLWDMPDGAAGHSKIDVLKKKVVIAILDEVDHNPNTAWAFDSEKTLVHELLHLHFETNTGTSDAQYVAMEQGIDCIANALVALKRQE